MVFRTRFTDKMVPLVNDESNKIISDCLLNKRLHCSVTLVLHNRISRMKDELRFAICRYLFSRKDKFRKVAFTPVSMTITLDKGFVLSFMCLKWLVDFSCTYLSVKCDNVITFI